MAVDVAPSPEELRALLESGFLLRERGELEPSKEVFEGVIALRPDLEVAHLGLANALHALGDLDKAEATFKRVVAQFPHSAHALAQLGEFYHTAGRREEALEALDKAIAIDPSGPFGEEARSIKALVEDGVGYTYKRPG